MRYSILGAVPGLPFASYRAARRNDWHWSGNKCFHSFRSFIRDCMSRLSQCSACLAGCHYYDNEILRRHSCSDWPGGERASCDSTEVDTDSAPIAHCLPGIPLMIRSMKVGMLGG